MNNHSISICLNTARTSPRLDWVLDSLTSQLEPADNFEIIIVDFFAQPCDDWTLTDVWTRRAQIEIAIVRNKLEGKVKWVAPMPSVWQGPQRLTKENWFANSAARNTFLLYATKKWILHLDDRCVLMPGFMDAVRANMNVPKVTFGKYEKRSGMKVENGIIVEAGTVTGVDGRHEYVRKNRNNDSPTPCGSEWFFGCCGLVPLKLLLSVNGWDIALDSLGMEDVMLGSQLANLPGVEFQYDHRMFMVEDRTPEACLPVMKRTDKGVSPNDRSHFYLEKLRGMNRASHPHNLVEMRKSVQSGQPCPFIRWPESDSFDGMKTEDFI